ncbi:MAG: PE-PPE domain-containing protein [Bacteroidetes bacterium]|nr:MAG: PE-PPE domain-containing protein [Bacteroidota bacterium]
MHNYNITEQGVPLQDAEKAVILIHGRGAPPEDILGLADFFDDGKTWFAAPEASNYVWYPYSFLVPAEQNQPWLNSAIANIETLIRNIEKQLPSEKIFIMGFSQGACLTAEVTSRNAKKYGGIAVFTGGLIGEQPDTSSYKGNFDGTKIYISNGDNDPHIPLSRTEETHEIMKGLGGETQLEVFPGRPHTINMEEINKVKEWFF